ncbi:MAG TPA: transposase [Planctomycetota bacterium]|nr:transposase [Planctomycetota bacterium]
MDSKSSTPSGNRFIWPHAPRHSLGDHGTYMVTAATHKKLHHFKGDERLDLLMRLLLQTAQAAQWKLQAWAVFPNHYHFVALSPPDPKSLKNLISKLHMRTAKEINRQDETPGRKVWYQYWDSQITYERSYWARLNYVHQNAVHHGIAGLAENYRWCSAAWFSRVADRAFYKTVSEFKTDQLEIEDEF